VPVYCFHHHQHQDIGPKLISGVIVCMGTVLYV